LTRKNSGNSCIDVTRFIIILLILIPSLLIWISIGEAQDGALVLDPSIDYTFGEELRFSLQAQHASDLEHLALIFRPELSPQIYEVEVPFQPGETISITQKVDVNNIDLKPFSQLTYSWEYKTASGAHKIPEQSIIYEDDSYKWQKMPRNNNTAHWVGEPPPFGLRILDIVDESLIQLEEFVPLDKVPPIDIYVYPSMVQLRESLPQNNSGNFQISRFNLGVILIATADSQTAEVDLPQRIPYELAQLLLYRAAGNNYDALPWWFREGFARSVQLVDNPQHRQLLAEAIQANATLPLQDLCDQPQGTGAQQDLAAFQSASVVNFLKEQQSTGTIPDLLLAYLNGSDCEQGVEQVLNMSLEALDKDWLDSMEQQTPFERFLGDLMIWIAILFPGTLLILFLIGATRKKEIDDR
jgi:hypothetical protein